MGEGRGVKYRESAEVRVYVQPTSSPWCKRGGGKDRGRRFTRDLILILLLTLLAFLLRTVIMLMG